MPLIKGNSNAVIGSNVKELMGSGYGQRQAVAISMSKAGKSDKKKSSRHKNLGNFLHPRKDGKSHGE